MSGPPGLYMQLPTDHHHINSLLLLRMDLKSAWWIQNTTPLSVGSIQLKQVCYALSFMMELRYSNLKQRGVRLHSVGRTDDLYSRMRTVLLSLKKRHVEPRWEKATKTISAEAIRSVGWWERSGFHMRLYVRVLITKQTTTEN